MIITSFLEGLGTVPGTLRLVSEVESGWGNVLRLLVQCLLGELQARTSTLLTWLLE